MLDSQAQGSTATFTASADMFSDSGEAAPVAQPAANPSTVETGETKVTTPEARGMEQVAETPVTDVNVPEPRFGKTPISKLLPPEQKPTDDKPVFPPKRNYDQFPEEDRPFLKDVGNKAFAYFEKRLPAILKEREEFAAKIKYLETKVTPQTSFFDHPEAYRLSKEYAETEKQITFVENQRDFWKQQLLRVEAGKEFQVPREITKDGEIIPESTLYKPSPELKLELQTLFNTATQNRENLLRSLDSHKNTFGESHKKVVADIDSKMSAHFPWHTKPELLKTTVNIPGIGTRSIEQMLEDFGTMVHPSLHSSPLFKACGNLLASVNILKAALAEEQAKHKVTEAKTKETPATTAITAGDQKPATKSFRMREELLA